MLAQSGIVATGLVAVNGRAPVATASIGWFQPSDRQAARGVIGGAAAMILGTAEPIFVPPISPIPQFDPSQPARLRGKASSPETIWTARHFGVGPATFPLPDHTVPARLRSPQSFRETENPITTAPGQFLPNFLPQWSEKEPLRKRAPIGPMAETTAPIFMPAISPIPQFDTTPPIRLKGKTASLETNWTAIHFGVGPTAFPLPDYTAPARLQGPRSFGETENPVTTASGQFLVNFVSQWAEKDAPPKRIPVVKALAETSTPLFTPAISPIALFDDAVARRLSMKGVFQDAAWLAQPRAVEPTTYPLPDDTKPSRLLAPKPLQETQNPATTALGQFLGNFVPPWIDQTRFPWIKSRRGVTDDIAPVFVPAVLSFVLFDDTGAKPMPQRLRLPDAAWLAQPAVIAAPPRLLPDDTKIARLPALKAIPETQGPLFFPGVTVAWVETQYAPWTLRRIGRLPDEPSPPTVLTPPAFGADWLEVTQTQKVARRKRIADDTSLPRTAAGQFLPNFVSEWGEQPQHFKLRSIRIFAPDYGPVFVPVVIFPHIIRRVRMAGRDIRASLTGIKVRASLTGRKAPPTLDGEVDQ